MPRTGRHTLFLPDDEVSPIASFTEPKPARSASPRQKHDRYTISRPRPCSSAKEFDGAQAALALAMMVLVLIRTGPRLRMAVARKHRRCSSQWPRHRSYPFDYRRAGANRPMAASHKRSQPKKRAGIGLGIVLAIGCASSASVACCDRLLGNDALDIEITRLRLAEDRR